MSHLYYEGLRLSAYPVVMQNSSFVVKSDLDRWGQQIAPSVSAWVKVSRKDTDPPTIQKLIRPSRCANAFRNLPGGEAAKLEEAQQQAEHEDGTESWGTVARRFISRWSCWDPDTRPTVTRSATLA